MNNDMIPVGTTVHINPEDIKWEVSGDLISRSALKKSIKSYADDQYAENEYLGEYAIMDIIDKAPAVEAYPFEQVQELVKLNQQFAQEIENLKRPQGEWIKITRKGTVPVEYVCSCCGRKIYDDYELSIPMSEFYPFCHCGAKMRDSAKGEFENV